MEFNKQREPGKAIFFPPEKKPSDEEAIAIIKLRPNENNEAYYNEQIMLLDYFYPGISDLMFWQKEKMTPEQILEKAKEVSKPIMLG